MTYQPGQFPYGGGPSQYQPPTTPDYGQPYGQPYGGQPQQYQPPEPEIAPAVWDGEEGNEFGGGGRKGISWEAAPQVPVPVGTRRMLLNEGKPKVSQKLDFRLKRITREASFWPDGTPKWRVQTDVIDENGEPVGIYCDQSSELSTAMRTARDENGGKVERGVVWDITYIGTRPNKMDPRSNPAKQFTVVMHRGEAALQMMTPAQRAVYTSWTDSGPGPATYSPSQAAPAPTYAPPTQPPTGYTPYVQPGPQAAAQPQPGPVYPPTPYVLPGQQPPTQPQGINGFSIEALTMFAGFSDEQFIAVVGERWQDAKAAVAQAKATGILPAY